MQLLDERVAFEEWRSYLAETMECCHSRIIITAPIIHDPFSYKIAGLSGSDIIHATFQPLR